MNDNTTKLLEQLAQKMGTTTEYLWNVLLKQAPIDATTILFQMFLIIIFGVTLFRLHKKFSTPVKKFDNRSFYYEYEELAAVPMILLAVVFIFLSIISLFSISDVINGYFNPEYWALKEVLDAI